MKTLASDNKQDSSTMAMLADKFIATPMWVKLATIILLLGYGVAINVELSSGSQRYTVYAQDSDNTFWCLAKDEAIKLQMKLEQQLAADNTDAKVLREKMNVIHKWVSCS